jgi:serine protease Do
MRLLFALLLALSPIAVLSANAHAHPAPDGFADLAERLSPAVVNISAAQTLGEDGDVPRFPPGSPLERYNSIFGDAPRIANSLGSGFIIDPSGLVVTNNHVIEDADAVEVALSDGRVFPAEILGVDVETDLALLQMQTEEEMPYVEFGDSDTARVGDWVIAIGNPFGLGGSLSAGVVSARGRDAGGRYDDYIQTDVAINTGNSGGPLFNMDGEVIGVNTLIFSPTGASVGISFSIPSELAEPVVEQLSEFGEARRGWMGVSVQEVSADTAESYGLDGVYGAIVNRVEPGGPADRAGIERFDLILEFDGVRVESDRALPRMVAGTAAGETVEVELIREDERLTLDVTVGRLDDGEEVEEEGGLSGLRGLLFPDGGEESGAVLGMTLGELDASTRRRFRVHPDAEGVVVLEVDASSDAAGKVRPGDVVEEVEFVRVDSVADVRRLVADARAEGDRPIRVQINRGGQYVLQSIRP